MRLALLLLTLALIPVGATVYRLADLAFWPATADTLRFHAAHWPVAVHITGGALFMILGALQLIPALRRHAWHRRAGRVAVVAGFLAAAAGLWMTLTFPAAPNNGPVLFALRLIAGTAWIVFLALAVQAIRQRQIARHRAYMARALAMAFGAGTTVITFGLWFAATGIDNDLTSALSQGAAWALNLALVEWALARHATPKGLPA